MPTFAAADAYAGTPSTHKKTNIDARKEWKSLTRVERKEKRKAVKQKLREIRDNKSNSDDTLLLVIIAILIPPLAMALYDGITNRFWISLLLTLLFYLPGLIYTLVVILGEN